MSEEDPMELPDELKKLEINSIKLPIKLPDANLPVNLNPFFYQVKFKDPILSEDSTSVSPASDIFGIQYSCRHNGNKLRNSRLDQRNAEVSIERQIKNKKSLKAKLSGTNKKIILKDPILKCLQNCIHYLNKFEIDASSNADLLSTLSSDCPNLDKLKIENNSSSTGDAAKTSSQTNRINFTSSGINEYLDFRNFTSDCSLITPNRNATKVKSTNKCDVQNFTTLQSRTNSRTQMLRNSYNNLKIDDDEQSDFCNDTIKEEPSSATNPNSNNTSTSCSQQARINASSSNCDITIDELASYFETFVHIPKKMSSMAEMMYI